MYESGQQPQDLALLSRLVTQLAFLLLFTDNALNSLHTAFR